MTLNRVSLYVAIFGAVIFLCGLGVCTDLSEAPQPGKSRDFTVLIIPAAGILITAYGLGTLRVRRRPCPICSSKEICAADKRDIGIVPDPFRFGLRCTDCGTIWITRAPKWAGAVTLMLGAVVGVIMIASLSNIGQGSGAYLLWPAGFLVLSGYGLGVLFGGIGAMRIVRHGTPRTSGAELPSR